MGASSSPHYEELPRQGAQGNLLRIDSTDDRIEAFRVGIQGSAARRVGADSQRLNDNRLQLNLERTRILTDGHGAADLRLRGALSEIEQEEGPMDVAAGDRNELQVTMTGVSGSGTRDNVYADVEGPSHPGNAGTDNRLVFQGSRQAWLDSNRALDPAPPERYFSVESVGRRE
jgi:hypothetical protein